MDKSGVIALSGHYFNYINDAVINISELFKQEKRDYNRRRRTIIKNITAMRRDQIKLLLLLAEHSKDLNHEKKLWQLDRASTFWEVDCQKLNDEGFKNKFRVNRQTFDELCNKLSCLQKQNTHFRMTIPLEKRIAIALYSLGSSEVYGSIGNLFGIGRSTVCKIVLDFCRIVLCVLGPTYLNYFPLRKDKIKECVNGFEVLGFPQCLGAVGLCSIEVYHNANVVDSAILLALIDHRCRFLYVNIGNLGPCNESQVFEKSSLKKQLGECQLLAKMSKRLSDVDVPVVILGDSDFRLSKTVMKPYPSNVYNNSTKKQYNYAFSKTRGVVENAFGYLKARFRRIGKGVNNNPENVDPIVKTCCVLHNFLNESNDSINKKWLWESQSTRQPQRETFINEGSGGEEIRQAIASYIGKFYSV